MSEREPDREMTPRTGRSKWEFVLYGALLLCFTLYLLLNGSSAMRVSVGEESVTITDPAGAVYQVKFSEIQTLETRTAPDFGECISGEETGGCRYGTWRNGAWGEYTLCALTDVDQVIILRTGERTVVFNVESADATARFYPAFQELLAQRLGSVPPSD